MEFDHGSSVPRSRTHGWYIISRLVSLKNRREEGLMHVMDVEAQTSSIGVVWKLRERVTVQVSFLSLDGSNLRGPSPIAFSQITDFESGSGLVCYTVSIRTDGSQHLNPDGFSYLRGHHISTIARLHFALRVLADLDTEVCNGYSDQRIPRPLID
ncbi:hypothetical protein TNCV_2870431 [Trichonephila clavipes]|nr:hypothetical protein TNCV_2870431 [Trichonephila clavipes]